MVEIRMPNLGMTMIEGVVKEWNKADSDTVNTGEVICEVTSETGKLNAILAAEQSGVLRIKLQVDERIECGGVIATIE